MTSLYRWWQITMFVGSIITTFAPQPPHSLDAPVLSNLTLPPQFPKQIVYTPNKSKHQHGQAAVRHLPHASCREQKATSVCPSTKSYVMTKYKRERREVPQRWVDILTSGQVKSLETPHGTLMKLVSPGFCMEKVTKGKSIASQRNRTPAVHNHSKQKALKLSYSRVPAETQDMLLFSPLCFVYKNTK